MKKNRNKKNTKQNIASKPSQSDIINFLKNMSVEEMQHIIAHAIVEAEEIKAQEEKEKKEQECLEWKKSIGHRDFSHIKNKYWRKIRICGNKIHKIFALLLIQKKKVSGDRASTALLQVILSSTFGILQIIAFLFGVSFLFGIFKPEILDITSLGVYGKIVAFFLALIFFLLFFVFRLVRFETEKISDKSYLFGLLASVTSLTSVLIAVIAIVKGT